MKEKILAIVADKMRIDVDKITDDANLVEDLGANSIDVVEVIMALEEEFNVQFDEDLAADMKTINDLVSYIEKNQ
ncbi:MAG: acyl carrier protein [Clostridia bacterium]|nr:acyl carrier protein [Clostridia bacterium]